MITVKAHENFIANLYSNMELNLGDKVSINGTLENIKKNTIFNLFNYKEYELSKNVHYKINIDRIIILKKNANIFYKIKNYIIKRIDEIKDSGYLKAFILGDNTYIDKEIKSYYRNNGISHLFSISGMHITFLSATILFLLNKIKKCKLNNIIVILFLIFYSFLTNFTPSVIRALLIFVFSFFNKKLELNLSTFKIFLMVLLLNLFINPYNIYNIGFLFSYIISIFLILFKDIIARNKNYILKIFVTSFISFLASIPLLIDNNFSINLTSIINNILFVPLVSIVIFPLTFMVLLIPKLKFILDLTIILLENLVRFVNLFKFEIVLCKTSIYVYLLYYLIIILILYKILNKNYKYIILIVLILIVHTNINLFKNNAYITFLDVGQGDSIFIHLPHNKGNILIDTGGIYRYDISSDIINYLKSKGVKKLDYLILTHGDYDHMGSSLNLVKNFKVEKVIFNNDEYNDLELDLIKVLKRNNIAYYKNISELNINNNKLYFLNTKMYENENDNSNVIYFNYKKYKFLFMGDSGIEKEKDILEKYDLNDIDFLKVGHHGSDTSSSKEFIDIINPKYSLISVGRNNIYGHPKDSVLKILSNSKIYRTDINGSIEIKLNGASYNIITCL